MIRAPSDTTFLFFPTEERSGTKRAERRIMLLKFVIALLATVAGLLVFEPGSLQAQEDVPVQVDLNVDRAELTVGGHVSMALDVTYPSGFQVVLPRLPHEWGALEVLNQSRTVVVDNGDGTETISQVITITAFRPGEFLTPALEISVREPAGGFSKKTAPPVALNVDSVLLEGDEELRDIRPQVYLDVPPIWPWVFAGLVAAGLLGSTILFALLRHRRQVVVAPVGDLRTHYEIALDEIARIKKLELPRQSRFKEHYVLVADVVRTYIEGEYRIPAMDRTTTELGTALRVFPIEIPGTREVIMFLSDCDFVKFTEMKPDVAAAHESTEEAHRLVDIIRPVPVISPGPNAVTSEA